MTGFGSARSAPVDVPGATGGDPPAHLPAFEVEVRSVNHRQLKLTIRVPDGLSSLVPRIEALVRERLARGSVYLHVRQAHVGGDVPYRLDHHLLKQLHAELSRCANELGVDRPDLGQVAALPGVVRQEEAPHDGEAVWSVLGPLTREALEHLDVMRREEGAGIGADLRGIAAEMLACADVIEADAPRIVDEQGERLRTRVRQLMGEQSLDPNDLAREVALIADRSDISEELQRLRSHAGQLEQALSGANGPVGRKLEFLAQELMREANTMASKSHETSLVDRILSIKLCVERIREQLANVE